MVTTFFKISRSISTRFSSARKRLISSRSALLAKQLTGVLPPEPRGSQPTMSNRPPVMASSAISGSVRPWSASRTRG